MIRTILAAVAALAVSAGAGDLDPSFDRDGKKLVEIPIPHELLVSRATGIAGAPAGDHSIDPSISADGRYVAFASLADNLSDEDNDAVRNVYVRDLQTGITTFVSRASGVAGEAGDGLSTSPSISADGRFVAFSSESQNFSDDDDAADDSPDVFVRDLKMSTTTFVSRASGPDGAGGDAPSDEPSISADGRFVAFQSVARNLGDGSLADGQRDIFVRDVQQDTTTFVSRAAQPADGSSLNPSISADGRYVAFESFARNLSDDDADGAVDIFVRDRQEGTTTYVSRGGDANSYAASVSADGRFVAFGSDAALDPADVDPSPSIFVRDLGAGTTRIVSGAIRGGALDASLSPDGRFVVFEQEVNDAAGEPQPGENIFVHDLVANTTAFVGRASPEPGEQEGVLLPYRPSISSGGRFVAFASEANSLSAEDDDAVRNVFVRDLRRPATSPPPAQPGRTLPPRAPRCAGRRATIVGTPGRDRLRGTRRADVIVALGGNDRVTAGRGRDLVCGGRGNDRLFGGRGRDRLIGGPGRDRTKQ